MTTPESRSTHPWAFIRPVEGPWLPAMHEVIHEIAGDTFTFRSTMSPGVSYADRNQLSSLPLFDGIDTFERAQEKAGEELDRIVHDVQLGLTSIATAISWEGLRYSSSASKRANGEIRIRVALEDTQQALGRQKLRFRQALGIPVDGEQPANQQAIAVGYLFSEATERGPLIDFRREINAARISLPPIVLGPVTLVEK